jgi:hypothetical protein
MGLKLSVQAWVVEDFVQDRYNKNLLQKDLLHSSVHTWSSNQLQRASILTLHRHYSYRSHSLL